MEPPWRQIREIRTTHPRGRFRGYPLRCPARWAIGHETALTCSVWCADGFPPSAFRHASLLALYYNSAQVRSHPEQSIGLVKRVWKYVRGPLEIYLFRCLSHQFPIVFLVVVPAL